MGQPPGLLFGLFPDFGFLADDPKTRAGHIGDHRVKAALQLRQGLSGVGLAGGQNLYAQPLRAALDQRQLLFVDIAGEDAPLIFHGDGRGKGFSARRGAGVQHIHTGLHPQDGDGHGRRPVLHIEKPLLKTRERGHIAALQAQAVFRVFRNGKLHLQPKQTAADALSVGFQGVDLQIKGWRAVVGGEKSLRESAALLLHNFFSDPPGMAVFDAEILRRALSGDWGQLIGAGGNLSQHGVYKPGGSGAAAALAKGHALVYGGSGRDLVQHGKLINAQAQDIPHPGFQLVRRGIAVTINVKIKKPAVLEYAQA